MKFNGKLGNQTLENGKKLKSRLTYIWALKFFFIDFSLYQMLDIVARRHCMQFQGKRNSQAQ